MQWGEKLKEIEKSTERIKTQNESKRVKGKRKRKIKENTMKWNECWKSKRSIKKRVIEKKRIERMKKMKDDFLKGEEAMKEEREGLVAKRNIFSIEGKHLIKT